MFSVSKTHFVFRRQKKELKAGVNLYLCHSGDYVSAAKRCDSFVDCSNDKSDEENCPHHVVTQKQSEFKNEMEEKCGLLFYTTSSNKCYLFADTLQGKENNTQPSIHTCVCKSEVTVDCALWNDLFIDCPDTQNDEPHQFSLLQSSKTQSCAVPGLLQCLKGHSKCYNMTDICKYKLDKNGLLHPCRNGGHLDNCNEFECNHKFKCFLSYCIPWVYVCDGKWDCPNGDDEHYHPVCSSDKVCVKMFKCGHDSSCIHLGNVCDGQQDCPQGDDEIWCELQSVNCPMKCECLAFALDAQISVMWKHMQLGGVC